MDAISHGLWGGISFGRKSKRFFLLAFLFSILPDVIPFAWLWTMSYISGIYDPANISLGATGYVVSIYNVTHSLIIALSVFLLAFLVFKKKAWIMAGWPLHILFDIPTHDLTFFPTPYLWPFSTPFFPGLPWWINSWVFYSDWIILIVLFAAWFILRRKKR